MLIIKTRNIIRKFPFFLLFFSQKIPFFFLFETLCNHSVIAICPSVCMCVRMYVCVQLALQQKPVGPKSSYLVHECTYGPHICTSNIFKMAAILKKIRPFFKFCLLTYRAYRSLYVKTSNRTSLAVCQQEALAVYHYRPLQRVR